MLHVSLHFTIITLINLIHLVFSLTPSLPPYFFCPLPFPSLIPSLSPPSLPPSFSPSPLFIPGTSERILQSKTDLYDVFVEQQHLITHLASLDPILRLTHADRERYDLLNRIR